MKTPEQWQAELAGEMSLEAIKAIQDDATGLTGVKWIPAGEALPDDELTVLVALACGEVWTGFHEAGEWRYVSADLIGEPVTHWAEFPAPPSPA